MAVAFLDPILDDKKFAAQVWWYAYRRAKPDEDPTAVMTRIMAFADGKADRKKADELAGFIETSRKEPKIDDGTRSTIVIGGLATGGAIADYAIAEAYRLTGIKDKAEEHYKKAVDHKADPADPAIADILDDWLDDDSPSPCRRNIDSCWPMPISCLHKRSRRTPRRNIAKRGSWRRFSR